ncbi:MAG: amidase family protein [Arenicellales bacterium]
MRRNPNLRRLSKRLSSGKKSCEEVIIECMVMADTEDGLFTWLDPNVIEQAKKIDLARESGDLPPLAGIPITLKDLFNVNGQKTTAGSKVLDAIGSEATEDAEVVAHLRDAGMLFLGRTNMSEFAFSGMGLNPHFPPLYSVWDRKTGRLPGGSSSGSAVSVALGIVPGTVGSDTAGSCRIPAAFNGIVGVKPSYGRLSLEGVYPLSPTSDAPGPLGEDVDTCFILDHVMTGKLGGELPKMSPENTMNMRLMVPDGIVMEDLDMEVNMAFRRAMKRLKAGGVDVVTGTLSAVDHSIDMFFNRPVVLFEAWQHHVKMLELHGDLYDPFVRQRIGGGKTVTAETQHQRYEEKAELVKFFNHDFAEAEIDALVYPTVACIPPAVSETDDPERIGAINLRCLRNTASVNYYDGCAITLPCHEQGMPPVGLMICCPHGQDEKLYNLAAKVESILREDE